MEIDRTSRNMIPGQPQSDDGGMNALLAKLLMQKAQEPAYVMPGEPPAKAWAPAIAQLGALLAGKREASANNARTQQLGDVLAGIAGGKEGGMMEGQLPQDGMGPGAPMQGPNVPYSENEKMALMARVPSLQGMVAQSMFKGPAERWEDVQGPRGSLLQRNSATGEKKKIVGTEDPTIMQMLLQQQAGRQEAVNDPNAPWKNIQDPKKQDEARTRFGVAADSRAAKEQEEVGVARQMINDLDRFTHLNETNATGGGYKVPGSQFIGTAVSDDVAEMKSITDKMTPMMRQGMPGAASDRDVAMFRGATVGLEKPQAANKNIATGLRSAAQNKVDRANFIAEYVTQYGHDRGADTKWKQYLEANPIFDPKSPTGSYKLNEKRMDYQPWLESGGKRIKGPAKTEQPATSKGGLSTEEKSELEQLRKELNGGR